jgi:hypothetical protein
LHTIRQHEIGPAAELFDDAENVVPATGIQAGRMIAELVQDLVHLVGRRHDLQQNGGFDRAARNAERVLGELENVIPQARLAMALELGQVKIRTTATFDRRAGVVEEVHAEVEQRASDRLAVDQHVFFGQVPATRANEQRRGLRVELVGAAIRILEGNGAPDSVDQIELALDHV